MVTKKALPLVCIIGRPNVGKSTLFNRIVGKKKAIVQNTPGVTRDRNYEKCYFGKHMFILVDTGGFETEIEDTIMKRCREQIQFAVEESDVIITVMDIKDGLTPDDKEIVSILRKHNKPFLIAINKSDSKKHKDNFIDFLELGFNNLYPISAEHGYGIQELIEAVVSMFPKTPSHKVNVGEDIKVAIVGRPNVGKSSLVNILLQQPRLIVDDIPGTTRDAIDTLLKRNGKLYTFIDTAGMRRKSRISQKIERYSVVAAIKSIERCDVAILMIDATEGITDQDIRIANLIKEAGKGCILLINKWDLVQKDSNTINLYSQQIRDKFKGFDYIPLLFVSVKEKKRINRIIPLVDTVYAEYCKRISTGELNKILEKSVGMHNPVVYKGKRVKFYFITQVDIKPPFFVLFVNYPEGVSQPYERYIINQIRAQFGFVGVPIKLKLKKRTNK